MNADKQQLLRIYKETEHLFDLPENDIPQEQKEWYLAHILSLITTGKLARVRLPKSPTFK